MLAQPFAEINTGVAGCFFWNYNMARVMKKVVVYMSTSFTEFFNLDNAGAPFLITYRCNTKSSIN